MRVPRRLAGMSRVDARKHDDRYLSCPERFAHGRERLIVRKTKRQFGDGVRGSGDHGVAIDAGMRAVLARDPRLDAHRQTGRSGDLRPVSVCVEPCAGSGSESDGDSPALINEGLHQLIVDQLKAAAP